MKPASRRRNLHVVTGAHVVKILFEGNQAVGVSYYRAGELRTALAEREVILSAGTINTPQILMLSGVGPAKHLAHLGIPLLTDLPVGENLQDHYGSLGLVATVDEDITMDLTKVRTPELILLTLVFSCSSTPFPHFSATLGTTADLGQFWVNISIFVQAEIKLSSVVRRGGGSGLAQHQVRQPLS